MTRVSIPFQSASVSKSEFTAGRLHERKGSFKLWDPSSSVDSWTSAWLIGAALSVDCEIPGAGDARTCWVLNWGCSLSCGELEILRDALFVTDD